MARADNETRRAIGGDEFADSHISDMQSEAAAMDGNVRYDAETDTFVETREDGSTISWIAGRGHEGRRERAQRVVELAQENAPGATIHYNGSEDDVTFVEPDAEGNPSSTFTMRAGNGRNPGDWGRRFQRARENSRAVEVEQEATQGRQEAPAVLERLLGLGPSSKELRYDAAEAGPSAARGVKEDRGALSREMRALDQLQDIYQQEGMTEADRAVMDMGKRQIQGMARQQREGALEGLAQQGLMSGGGQLAARMQAQAQTGNALADFNAQNMAAARQRALQANQSQLEGAAGRAERRGQFGLDRAGAMDEHTRDQAKRTDEASRFGIEGVRDVYGQRLSGASNLGNIKLGASGQALSQYENTMNRQAGREAQNIPGWQKAMSVIPIVSDITKAAVTNGASLAKDDDSDIRVKEDISPVNSEEISEMLELLKPAKYRYKESGEPRMGVMAQDLEQSELGSRMVDEGPDGVKQIKNSPSATLAALASLDERLKKLGG